MRNKINLVFRNFAIWLIAFGLVAWTLNMVIGCYEARSELDQLIAITSDLGAIAQQLKVLEATKSQIALDEVKSTVKLGSNARWENIRIFPFAPDGAPYVEYRGPLTSPSYLVCWRSGSTFVLKDQKEIGKSSPND